MDVGKVLRTERKNQGKSIKEVAARSGVHRNTIAAAERGERQMTVPNLIAVARTLGIALSKVGIMEGGMVGPEYQPFPPDPTAQITASLLRLAHAGPEVQRRILGQLDPYESLALARVLMERAAVPVAVGEPDQPKARRR